LAARILSEQFSHVTIVERDRLPDVPEFRRGVPQARHAHTLQPEGQLILESHFPGLVDELLAGGAIAIAAGRDLVFFQGGTWRRPRPRETQVSIACSRPLLETIIHRRVAGRANVRILPGYETVGLRADERSQRVTGVRLRHRHQAAAAETVLGADLVVDAGGRQSQSPRWLHGLGYTPPEEWAVNSFVGYATRIYRRPAGLASDWKVLYVRPTPADGPRGGIILPVEGGGWHVTLIGVAGDYPPTDEAGFLAFARGLPTPRLYEAIRDAEPLTKPLGFRRTENRVRRYDRLPRYLEGFIVCGDAVYALNPIYAQGMTAAAIGGQVLARCLQARRRQPGAEGLNGLAETYQRELSEAVAGLWQMATRKDWDWPITEVTDTIFQLPTPLPPARRANATAAFHGYA
jgi:2-polyprenyl-6-methoxyphenol hydroxylase-like FAD-dependent oxidoreductase